MSRRPHYYYHSDHFMHAPIFRLLLKVAVNGSHQCDFLNCCGYANTQQNHRSLSSPLGIPCCPMSKNRPRTHPPTSRSACQPSNPSPKHRTTTAPLLFPTLPLPWEGFKYQADPSPICWSVLLCTRDVLSGSPSPVGCRLYE